MASVSSALSNNSGDTTGSNVVRTTGPMVMSPSMKSSKNLRGLNKPKCITCGNVARSRCPYQACKSCCAKAQNPCHIHVLKAANSSLPDKTPSSAFTDQHSNEISSSGNAHRVTSLRQLSSNFSQFNNLQTPSRARKPLTRKEASQINEWRFSKLKEYEERNIEIEDEAFDRYLQNIRLLEEVFAKYELAEDRMEQGKNETKISNLKTRFRADPARSENLREKLRFIINNGLRNLKSETPGNEEAEHASTPKKARYSSLVELNKKLSSARTLEDLRSCQLLKASLFNQPEPIEQTVEESEELEDEKDGKAEQKLENYKLNWFSPVTINQESLGHIDARFSSLEEIEHL